MISSKGGIKMQAKIFNVYVTNNQAVYDAYAMLAANIYVCNNRKVLKTLALLSCNPNEGKTSLAISLAITMARSGWKVLLVDADMRKPITAKRLEKGALFGLSDYLTGEVMLDDALCETNIYNLTYLSCGQNRLNPIGILCSVQFEKLLDKVQGAYDYIIFDTPALSTVFDGGYIASKVDAAMLVVNIGLTPLKNLKRVKKQLDDLNVNILGVVLNKIPKYNYKLYFKSYNYLLNPKRFLKSQRFKNKLPIIGRKSPDQNI
jgi:capsular exopolysaccharide synthesis family protein